MLTCERCHKTVKDGQQIDHWICEDCKVEVAKKEANQQEANHQNKTK